MPVAYLNNAATTDAYADPTTVVFAYGRPAFSVQVSNASIYYTLGILGPAGRDINWSSIESFSLPAMLSFGDPSGEGFPPGSVYAGIKVRSGAAGKPARVTVA